ncbi:PAS domain-containing sensor histidine kinase [Microbacteriaceae bacterium K1510]|nr:PAS domain-containing sensor histidine kinase [Microbacteriaceae bacterium K1510]
MSFLTPVWNYVDTLVHPVAQQDALTAARHRAFIAPRLIGSFAALASFPVYLAFRGAPSLLEVAVFGWLIAPILTAYYLSRTGRYESAHALSSVALTGLVTVVAWCTGGIGSFAAIWLVVVPLEAALSASRRVVALASTCALIGAGLLVGLSTFDLVPAPADVGNAHGALVSLGIISAALYATGLALGAETLARTSFWLLYAEEDRYRLLARNMTDAITRHGRNGAVLFASPAAEPLFGVRAAELAGHGLFDRVHVADRPAYLTALAEAADGGDRSVEFRIHRRESDDDHAGTFTWVEMRCRPLDRVQDSNGDTREVVAVLRDVSERKTQERALEIARAESERANAAKSHFLATMSHELRTPLNAIIGFSDMLTNESLVLDPARKIEYARLINESGHHLLSVVNGILDMSKMETGNFEITPEPFAPAPAITSCCDILALKARDAGVEIKTRIADLPELMADRRAFNQILINLVSNAIKFTPRGGRISVSAFTEGHKLAVVVEDTGVGIGEDDLPRIGEAFFQARASYDRRHDGTGLGLSIVKGLVRLHDGDIDIASRLGKGTRITVRLPVDGESGHRPADPIKLVTERAKELATVANVRIKKSA